LTAATGGSQTIRFERFTFQASGSAGGIDSVPLLSDNPYWVAESVFSPMMESVRPNEEDGTVDRHLGMRVMLAG